MKIECGLLSAELDLVEALHRLLPLDLRRADLVAEALGSLKAARLQSEDISVINFLRKVRLAGP